MANPTYRSSSSAADQTGSTDFSVTTPIGTIDGDMLYFFQVQSGSNTTSLPSGFTADKTQIISGFGFVLFTGYKIASSELASQTFHNASSLTVSSAYLLAIQNPTGTSPEGGSKASGNSATADPGTYTTLTDNDLILAGWGASATSSITPDGSFTALGEIGATANLNVGYKTQSPAGVVGNRSATLGISSPWGAILAAIKAPAAVPFVPYDIPHSPSHQAMVAM